MLTTPDDLLEMIFRFSCSITFPWIEMKLTGLYLCVLLALFIDGSDALLKTSGSSLNCHDYSISASGL